MWTAAAFLLICVVSLWAQERPLVETSLGKIRGYHKHSYDGRVFSAFEGIPYAKPPVGELRFEEPVDIEPWSGIWESNPPNKCTQLNNFNKQIQGSEDCLYLNVYAPRERPIAGENLDVVVHIHGGAFMAGSSTKKSPECFMDRDIIYISLNYRLGALGFLSTEDEIVPGNNGLKDQIKALQWIQNHIDKFGGNPNSVTITGVSAGGCSVHFHLLSPLSKGLFHKAISQSGTVLAPWTIQDTPLEIAKTLGVRLGCDTTTTKDLVKCLKQRPAKELTKQLDIGSPIHTFPIAPFAPVVERKSKIPFLNKQPYEMLECGDLNDVPWITSVASEEGIIGVMLLNNSFEVLNEQWDEALPYVLDYTNTVTDSTKIEVAHKIKEYYFNNQNVSDINIQSFIKMIGDRHFYLSAEKSARIQAKALKSSTYFYMYGYRRESILPYYLLFGFKKYLGVGHGEEGHLLFMKKYGELNVTTQKQREADEQMKNVLLDIITSFARDGKPSVQDVEWSPVEHSGDFRYLHLHNDGTEMAYAKEIAPAEFWNELPIKEDEDASLRDAIN